MLTEDQVRQYERDGYLLLPGLLDGAELDRLRGELPLVFGESAPRRVLEAGTGVVRGVHGVHETNPVFETLVRLPRLVEPARRLLGDDVYVHQFKINAKLALVGEVWEWHQDYRFWHDEDGMPAPRALSAAVFLDAVDEFNGPLMLVPGSHRDGMHDVTVREDADWSQTLSAKLKYSLKVEALAAATRERGIVAPKGPAGTVLLFHSAILHGSVPNMSPNNRTLVLVSYNSVRNRLREVPRPRPHFVASRDFTPLRTVPDDALTAAGHGRVPV
ncbi:MULTISPECIES: phytanoyl-CoA dioxygenase family protein [Streptomyces]|uniref:phytanoyl-CoA dioxygenase family protein n=1 Tax=Streptomyces TaxID=1883 RepID=UPI0022499066|nr:phytanoyl-CoA dioxygenase family protein [Streptomyces sp. JHD 1]MCX2969320.1 phytanoyl-CoA dioxygenase family protein [Streptomyces sp. JHD 1]